MCIQSIDRSRPITTMSNKTVLQRLRDYSINEINYENKYEINY